MLKRDLDVDTAIQIALLNNPKIQASFEDLGIAQADLVQAGLFQNPIFQGFARYPNKRSLDTNVELSVTQSFMNIFLIPLRKKIAETELEQAQYMVANLVIDLAFDIRETFYSLQAEQLKLELLELFVDVSSANNLLAVKQHEAGNINALELQNHTRQFLQAKLDLSHTQNQIAELRKILNTLLGMRPSQNKWHLTNDLPILPEEEVLKETLHDLALSQRLDVAYARLEIKRILQMGATKEWWAFTDPAIGVSGERDVDGTRVLGPTISTSIPFFDHGQADRARLLSLLKQSEHRLEALEIDVLAEVTRSYNQLLINRERVTIYQNEYMPLQENIITTSQNFYNVMGLSVYILLQNKQEELNAKIEYTSALKDYWLTRVELDRALGGTVCK
ncbi:MAG: TolC family protein [Chlamydiales bacterium]|nr:TolC family protein [Chlamydiales bacterium]